MLDNFKKHPFSVESFFESSVVLTFAAPKDELEHLIPKELSLDLFNNKWGFIAAALVETKNLRPKGFPKVLGNDFFLIGFRVFVKYKSNNGKRLRGLYILKSETNKKKMEFFGNMFTNYNYSTTDIQDSFQKNRRRIQSAKSNFNIEINTSINDALLPVDSPFKDFKEARRFAGPLPFTFTVKKNEIIIIEGVRKNWKPIPLEIESCHFQFLDDLKIKNLRLANAFEISQIPYYWKKGRIEILNN